MEGTTTNVPVLWPLVVYFAAILALVGTMIVLSWLLGQRHHDRATGEPYESSFTSWPLVRLHACGGWC
jgi:NADH-quinone oxidoreductase subunit A